MIKKLFLKKIQSKYMKFCFSLLLIIFLTNIAFTKNVESTYEVRTKGIKIGELIWGFEEHGGDYKIFINLKSVGFLSGLYKFNGRYVATGKKINKQLFPATYTQVWVTKKKRRDVNIFFENFKIKNLILIPEEKELARLEYKKIKNQKDPLSSFVNILLSQSPSSTIDGRRSYLLVPKKVNEVIKITIEDYINIWTDHKRNDLEYLEIHPSQELLPNKINISFKGSIFSINKI